MKILLLSDLHLEFGLISIPKIECDVVVLGGDIGVGTMGVEWAERTFPSTPTLYICGNHEFYGRQLDATLDEIRAAAERTANVRLLEQEEIVIEGVRFVAATLWTDFALFGCTNIDHAMERARTSMSDYFTITTREEATGRVRRLRPADTAKMHRATVRWLRGALRRYHAGKTVVVTHHAPHWRSVHDQYVNDELTPAFVTHLEHLMGPDVAVWFHGHTHDSFSYEERGTRVYCNPRGYEQHELNPDFKADFVVEV